MSATINPWEILNYRRMIKNYNKTGIPETMKILKKVRDMNLDNKMLKAVEFTRTLVYISTRLQKAQDQDKKKLFTMAKFLYKQWKKQLKSEIKQGGQRQKQKQNGQKKEKEKNKEAEQKANAEQRKNQE